MSGNDQLEGMLVRSRMEKRPNLKWLQPGLGIKRWVGVLVLGITLIGLGLTYLLINVYREQSSSTLFYYVTLQFLPRLMRASIAGGLGIISIVVALKQLSRSILAPFLRPGQPVVDAVYRHRQREKGPKIVAIGGGHGLSTLLRGLKEQTSHLTAIVTVADDGGSSGRLRRELGVLPPGDFRNCIAALADDESLMTQLFQYRFGQGPGLDGHSFGNLLITAMAQVTGSFEQALLESSRVLAIQGRVLPSTLQDVTLMADLREEQNGELSRVAGESRIPQAKGTIERVFLRPEKVRPYPGALQAILEADLVIAGPGSLYTSLLPNLLVEGIVPAIKASRAVKVFVCNVATQQGETDHYNVDHHVSALIQHVGPGVFTVVLANDDLAPAEELPPGVDNVRPPDLSDERSYALITTNLTDPDCPWRHDPDRLAQALIDLWMKEALQKESPLQSWPFTAQEVPNRLSNP